SRAAVRGGRRRVRRWYRPRRGWLARTRTRGNARRRARQVRVREAVSRGELDPRAAHPRIASAKARRQHTTSEPLRQPPRLESAPARYLLILKLLCAGLGSCPPGPTARTLNVYSPGFRCL